MTEAVVRYDPRRRRWVTAGVLLVLSLAALESTAVLMTMPTVTRQMGGLQYYPWLYTCYMVAATASLFLWGRLSDHFGRKAVYLAGLFVFLMGAFLCGLSENIGTLLAARFLQGAGAGSLLPLSFAVLGESYSLDERARMQGLISGVWGFASVLGPVIGGLVTELLSWRWVFWISLFPGGAAFLFLLRYQQNQPARHPLDASSWLILLLLLTLSSLVAGVQLLGQGVPALAFLLLLLGVGGGAMLLWLHARLGLRLLPWEEMREPVLWVALVNGFLIAGAVFGALVYIPLMGEELLGLSPAGVGELLVPFSLAWVGSSAWAGLNYRRIGMRRLLLAGGTLAVAGFGLELLVLRAPHPVGVALGLALIGAGMGLSISPLTFTLQFYFPRSRIGSVTGAFQFFRGFGAVTGVALMGTLLMGSLLQALPAPLQGSLNFQLLRALLTEQFEGMLGSSQVSLLREALLQGFRILFQVGAVGAVLALWVARWFPEVRFPESRA